MNSPPTNTEFHVRMTPGHVSSIMFLRANYQNAITCYSTASPEIVSNNITMNIGWAVYDGGRLRDNFIQGNKQVGPNITELAVGIQGDQYYGVEEVFEPRNSPVAEAGVPRENF